jgi:hypothetical protein
MNDVEKAPVKPGDVALVCTRRRVLAIRVDRVWLSLGGTIRVEARADGRIRPGTSFDVRQCLTLAGLENLSAENEKSATAEMAGVSAELSRSASV